MAFDLSGNAFPESPSGGGSVRPVRVLVYPPHRERPTPNAVAFAVGGITKFGVGSGGQYAVLPLFNAGGGYGNPIVDVAPAFIGGGISLPDQLQGRIATVTLACFEAPNSVAYTDSSAALGLALSRKLGYTDSVPTSLYPGWEWVPLFPNPYGGIASVTLPASLDIPPGGKVLPWVNNRDGVAHIVRIYLYGWYWPIDLADEDFGAN